MSVLEAVRAIEEGRLTESEGLEITGFISLLDLYEAAMVEAEGAQSA